MHNTFFKKSNLKKFQILNFKFQISTSSNFLFQLPTSNNFHFHFQLSTSNNFQILILKLPITSKFLIFKLPTTWTQLPKTKNQSCILKLFKLNIVN